MKHLRILLLLLLGLTACAPKTNHNNSINTSIPATVTVTQNRTKEHHSTNTAIILSSPTVPLPTTSPTLIKTKTRTITPEPTIDLTTPTIPDATLSAEETIEKFGDPCDANFRHYFSRMSPDRQWIAAICKGKSDEYSSYLKIYSITNGTSWYIYFKDFTGETGFFSDDLLEPFHWSRDMKYLYVVSPTRYSGMIGLGPGGRMLIRLNLRNGRTTEILNYEKDEENTIPQISFAFSPSDRYLLYIPQSGNPYEMTIIDLGTWKTSAIEIQAENIIGAGYAVWSKDEEEIILLAENFNESDHVSTFSLILINMIYGTQATIVAKMEDWEQLYPIEWKDKDHVYLSSSWDTTSLGAQWLLNVRTGELKKSINP